MGRPKKLQKLKEPVKIRQLKLANGNESLYLDFYENGKRWYETLNLYLVHEVDEIAKRENKNAKEQAIAIKAKRQLRIPKEPEIINGKKDFSPIFMEWLDVYLKEIHDNNAYSYFRNIRSMVNVVKEYLKYRAIGYKSRCLK